MKSAEVVGKPGFHLGQLRLEASSKNQGKKSRDSGIEKCQIQEKVLDKKSRFREIQCMSQLFQNDMPKCSQARSPRLGTSTVRL